MSRLWLLIGLLVSASAHAWLLRPTDGQDPAALATRAIAVVPIARPEPPANDPARGDADDPAPLEPEPEPTSEPEPEPEPEPAEPRTPEPLPEPEAEPPSPPAPPSVSEDQTPSSGEASLLDDLADTTAPLADARPEFDAPGDFAGTPQGEARPVLRIDWGSPAEAAATLDAGGMRLIVVAEAGGRLDLVGEVRGFPARPLITSAAPPRGYANRLRMLEDVPAFAGVARELPSDRRLAVLVPREVERRLRAKVMEVLFRSGLDASEVSHIAGRWRRGSTGVDLEVTHLTRRRGS